MSEEKVSQRGMPYLTKVLKKKATVVTEAALWKIKHHSGTEEISLKVGRYSLSNGKKPATANPKSALTLDPDEMTALLNFLEQNYEPFRTGARRWIALDKDFGAEQVTQLRAIFANPDRRKLVEFLVQNNIVPDDLVRSLDYQKRCRAVQQFEEMLSQDLTEQPWQQWFENNDWVLGSEFVRVLDEREIDVDHIADYLVQAYDGFLDVVEIKRPEGVLKFWADSQDHGNYIQHSDLTKAIGQATRYLYEVEREANSDKFIQRVGVRAVKPRCVLIFGRSDTWNDGQKEAYRILNASQSNLSILTFDHVLDRARRMLNLQPRN
jgi:hypothetical protein